MLEMRINYLVPFDLPLTQMQINSASWVTENLLPGKAMHTPHVTMHIAGPMLQIQDFFTPVLGIEPIVLALSSSPSVFCVTFYFDTGFC